MIFVASALRASVLAAARSCGMVADDAIGLDDSRYMGAATAFDAIDDVMPLTDLSG